MALAQPQPQQDRKRVKVYELKNNDWYDRGTGFCSGQIVQSPNSSPENPDARILVVSEDDPNRTLLETRITKDDGYQKQQDTLIVWTESNGVDMALSFQEAEGCAGIWEFVSEIQSRLATLAPDDGLSDDLLDPPHPIILPEPQLGRLDEIENAIRAASTTPAGRDALGKFIMSSDVMYIMKLAPLVEMAEDLQATPDLHRLCTIMKHLILLNDTQIIEFVVTDQAIMGVVGALEYDPDFPSHRANHRQYLSDSSKFKEVVPIKDVDIRKKIHYTYRLLYLKDVVLARILDDPTFSVLNSLIFFHQVDIVHHLQSNQEFLKQLFGIFATVDNDDGKDTTGKALGKKKEAVLFIQNCCAVSKNIQAQSRAQLYNNFIHHGLFTVITFALRHHDASVRVAGTDILVALIDHDPHMVRNHIFNAIKEKMTPLTDILIELLLVEVDLGVKSQMADAIKILLDPSSTNGPMDALSRQAAQNPELMAKRGGPQPNPQAAPQTDAFIQSFYDDSAKRLFQPLKDLERRTSMQTLSVHETSLMTHLVEVLCFFVRQHAYRSKLFILSEGLHARVAQLLACPQKYMKLTALKWFRTCIGLQDEFHNRQLIQHRLFEPILNIVYETMPRDNLLNSACLELFEYIKRESVKQLIVHLVENYRERMQGITYVATFQHLVAKYEQMHSGYVPSTNGAEDSSFTTQEGTPRMVNGHQRFSGLKEMEHDEEVYFNTEDDIEGDEDEEVGLPKSVGLPNGASPVRPLVNYPLDEDEDEAMDLLASSPDPLKEKKSSASSSSDPATTDSTDAEADSGSMDVEAAETRGRNRTPVPVEGSPGRQQSPPEPLAMKRRREEDDEDELGKMMGGVKRRSSTASLSSQTGRLQMDGSASPKSAGGNNHRLPVQQHYQQYLEENAAHASPPQQQPGAAAAVPHGHALRRKGSLKTRNETPLGTGAGKFAIKPVALAAAKGPAEQHQHSAEGNGNSTTAHENSDSGDGDGSGGGNG